MRKLLFVFVSIAGLVLTSCEKSISPETAKAFVGEYWMETTNVGVIGNEEVFLNEKSSWTPVSIYEKSGKLYVQTEFYGAPDTISEHPQEIEGSHERPDFISPRRILKEEGDSTDNSGIETIVTTNKSVIIIRNGFILAINRGVTAKSLPIKVKSGSETILNLEAFKPVDVQLTNMDGTKLQTIHAWYEYGPMIKKNDMITWEVELKDDYNNYLDEYDHVIHKNILYKR